MLRVLVGSWGGGERKNPHVEDRIYKTVRPTGDGRRAPVILTPEEVQRPENVVIEGSWRWKCFNNCTKHSGRKAEAERHIQTHHDVRYLCENPACPMLLARPDAVTRHLENTECRGYLPPGKTVGDETPTVGKRHAPVAGLSGTFNASTAHRTAQTQFLAPK
ncbi:hypothetical protein JB92DRAFT_2830303 [Gautieria morchelliformis]|nr:hypothetical protein JB92DRAFT_2830303 [Gautieria morchelliformis]